MKKELSPGLQRLSAELHYGGSSGGIYETTKREVEPDTLSSTAKNGKKYGARWGHDNNFAQRLIDALKSDPSAGLIGRKIDFHFGGGLMFYKKIVENGVQAIHIIPDEEVPKEIKDFMELNDWEEFMEGIISDYEWWNMFYVQYITSNDGKIVEVKWQRAKDVRSDFRNPNTGEVDQFFLSGYWPNPKSDEVATIPAFKKNLNVSGIKKHGSVSVDKDYYNDPDWHSITRWLYIASKIPRWILANIDNSMNIKYHVEIPFKYFTDRCPADSYKSDAEHQDAIEKLIEKTFTDMDKYLTGEKNVHKAFYSFINMLEDGKEAPGWKITPLENKVQDEAWLRAYGTAAMAMISGIGLSASVAGTILPNGLGSGSGSDLREQFNFYIQVRTPRPRSKTLQPWNIIKKRNNWPEWLHMGYSDIILQSLDQNKSGFAKKNEESPTSDKQTKDTMSV